METERLRLAIDGSAGLVQRVRAAAKRLGCEIVEPAPHAADVIVLEAPLAEIHSVCRRVRELASGTAVLAVASGRRAGLREALFEAGAADVVSASISVGELAWRVEGAGRHGRANERLRQLDRELVLVSSLARRLVRSGDTPSLLEDALTGLSRAIELDSAEILVLASPWRLEGEASLALRWSEPEGLTRRRQVALGELDLEALRRRMPVRDREHPDRSVVVPLLAQGQALAVLRASVPSHDELSDEALRVLYSVGSLLAGAMENAERLASLKGRSRSLEALVEERTREAEQQKQLFQEVIDALPVSLHAIDRAFRVVVWNLGREGGPFGRPRGEVLGRSLFSVVGEDAELRNEYERVFGTGEPIISEVESLGGELPRLYRVEKIPMRLGPAGEVSHTITVGRDVTEQRALERSMARADKMSAIGRLAAGIAHEINNPLATIASCAESMRARLQHPIDEDERGEIGADAVVIEQEAYRCKSILGNLLDFSRSSPEDRSCCLLADLARRTLRLLQHNPRFGDVAIELHADEPVPPALVCEDQLVQVLMALLLNAADAAAPGGTVAVRTRVGPAGEAVISVEDDGPGIPAELHERIFEPFFTTKPPGQGTGLGLAVAYGIVKAHAGRLEMLSHPGLGTRFDVVLPAMAEQPEEVEA
ncbi:MAG: PAS domain-containing protein [Acidobacteriota bacterium]|nr:MAG: PAS domain-containing protein [Acidobacteriota bacterium]